MPASNPTNKPKETKTMVSIMITIIFYKFLNI
jgi:hypothetical protein